MIFGRKNVLEVRWGGMVIFREVGWGFSIFDFFSEFTEIVVVCRDADTCRLFI